MFLLAIAGSQLVHFLLQPLNLLDILVLLFRQLAHVDVVNIDINVVDSHRSILDASFLHGHVLLRLLHVFDHLCLLSVKLLIVIISALFLGCSLVFEGHSTCTSRHPRPPRPIPTSPSTAPIRNSTPAILRRILLVTATTSLILSGVATTPPIILALFVFRLSASWTF